MLASYVRLEILRMLRNRRYLIIGIGFPLVIYLLNANVFGKETTGDGVSLSAYVMVSMAAYGAISGALTNTAGPWSQERASGWLPQLQVTPLRGWMIIVGKMAGALTLVLPSMLLVCLAGALTQGVSLSAGQWAALVGALWAGAVPFVALGMIAGSLLRPDAVQPVTLITMLGLVIVGGLWFPVTTMGATMRSIAEASPAYSYADMGWSVIAGHGVPLSDALTTAGWAAALGLLAVLAYRRATVRA
ncbi:ABC transporter permease [Nonomuraea roseoviolacea subsp. roseoviolacea]|uniref:ABC-2 type transport system permease protein n=1 Tax=Nonomuraea roseoviolacea subsp. carminata TaxID=160689 RepID=A0ABT1K977_9ACTN|nr:ABC transporter permease [Nonomuraea roseoviolacea]MCP2350531.1 ABC-2 type transport system permease protein [Nonomuraea roseoviolacea subsp. carminata]